MIGKKNFASESVNSSDVLCINLKIRTFVTKVLCCFIRLRTPVYPSEGRIFCNESVKKECGATEDEVI
jgi:hypothetical protein